MSQEKRRIMVVEPNCSGGIELLKSARRMGVEVHVVTHEDLYQQNYSAELKEMIDHTLFTNFCVEAEAIADMVEYGKKIGIEGVVAGFEFVSDMTVKVASELGLPTHDPLKCEALRRKDLMHQHFVANQVACAKSIIVQKWDECIAAALEIGYPVVIKPSSNAGSCSVFKVNSEEELKKAFEVIHANNVEFPHGMALDDHMLIQEFLSGPEVSVEVVVFNGDVSVLAITDKTTTTGNYFAEIGHTLPSKLYPREQKLVVDMTKLAVHSLGLKNGIGHVELKLTKDGVKIIEVGARMPGDKIPNLLLHACGIDEGIVYIQASIGQFPDVTPRNHQFAAIQFITSDCEGVIESIGRLEGIQNVSSNGEEGIVDVEIYVEEGQKIGVPINNIDRIGHIIAVSNSYERASALCSEALEKIELQIVEQ
ncbi:ATP-grasp domain-containing protein [Thermoactinomyces sp. DSM 45892]|uniref:ATP-grasp domain-containing protein n=1 Tax=Thermoactinomyces sp. DSM 45892 TaxID=1882753 RepID=UPI00089BE853|nr:ATP-grasp domain-containing protein [Thermoactinomyces sp. DSM 45892]SDY39618.1 argininosuccinate lyase [Thermoactinomyces sp. DSM 45892]